MAAQQTLVLGQENCMWHGAFAGYDLTNSNKINSITKPIHYMQTFLKMHVDQFLIKQWNLKSCMLIAKLIFLPNKCFQTVVSTYVQSVMNTSECVRRSHRHLKGSIILHVSRKQHYFLFSKNRHFNKTEIVFNFGNNGNSLVYRKLRKVWCVRSSVSQAISLGHSGC